MTLITLAKIILFLAGLIILVKIIVFPFHRARRHDLIFLGSSRTRYGINPAAVDRIAGTTSRNVEKSSITPADAYLMLKKIIRNYRPKILVIEISDLGFFCKPDIPAPSAPLPPFMRDVHTIVKKRRSVLRAWSRLFVSAFGRPRCEVRKKTGFKTLKRKLDRDAQIGFRGGKWTKKYINKKQLDYLYRILNLCRAKKIKAVLLSMPVHPSCLLYRKDIQDAHNFFERVAASYGIPYWDLRLLSDNAIRQSDQLFADWAHLSPKGAQVFSKYLGHRLLAHKNGQNAPADHCVDFKNRIQEIKGIAGILLKALPAEPRRAYRVSGTVLRADPDLPAEYRFEAHDERSARIWVRGYSPDPSADFLAPGPGTVKISVYVREPGSQNDYDAMQRISIKVS